MDPIPGLPSGGIGLLSYKHVEPSYYIGTGNGAPVTPNDIFKQFLPDLGSIDVNHIPAWWNDNAPVAGYDNNVTSGFGVPGAAAHLWYFRQVNGCDPKTKDVTTVWPPFTDELY